MKAQTLLVWCPFPDQAVARQIAAQVIPQGLAACVHFFAEGESHYLWQGKLEKSTEIMTVWKTTSDRWEALSKMLAELHPYDVPAVLATSVAAGYPPYLAWLHESMMPADRPDV